MFKTLISFVAGGVTGGVITYMVYKEKFRQKYEQDVEAMEHYYQSQISKDIPQVEKVELNDDASKKNKLVINASNEKELFSQVVKKTKYNKGITGSDVESVDDAEVESPSDDTYYVGAINDEEWEKNPFSYKHVDLTFYAEDGVLADEDDNALNVFDTLGPRGHEIVEPLFVGRGVVYVRDERVSTEYQIFGVQSSYARLVGSYNM